MHSPSSSKRSVSPPAANKNNLSYYEIYDNDKPAKKIEVISSTYFGAAGDDEEVVFSSSTEQEGSGAV